MVTSEVLHEISDRALLKQNGIGTYRISSCQVPDKWFKSHKGKTMTIDDFDHIVNAVGLLTETIKVQYDLKNLHSN